MMYSEEELKRDLKSVKTGDDMNRIREKCLNTGVEWDKVSIETKKLYANIQTRIHPCPDSYRKNPHIHYDIPHFCSDGKLKNDTTSQ